MIEKIKELWENVEDWYYDVCDSFAFLVSWTASIFTITVFVCKWAYKRFYVKPVINEFDRRFGKF